MEDESDESPSDAPETDERFPSGPWLGFWLQRGVDGRQWMRDLWLDFCNGKIEGAGVDRVGHFTIRGNYDLKNGQCALFKRYLAAHTVVYEGQNESDGLWIWGVWTLASGERGGFHIWPDGMPDPTVDRLEADVDTPVEAVARA